MAAVTVMQQRAPRAAVSFPVLFTGMDGDPIEGTCENLSESGLLALFASPLDIWIDGTIDLLFGTGLLGIHVRVARVVGAQAGLAFHDLHDDHRHAVRELLLAAQQVGSLPDHLRPGQCDRTTAGSA